MPGYGHKALAYALLRMTVGLMFFVFGVSKFLRGLDTVALGMQSRMAEAPMPEFLVGAFARVLPFGEVAIGLLLMVGLFTRGALVAAALLMMALTVGVVLEPSPATVAANVNYALIIVALLWLSEYDGYSVDHLRDRRSASGGNKP